MRGYDDTSYGEAWADIYDDLYSDITPVTQFVELLRDVGRDGPFLELGVGTGRIAAPLAATGVPVTGIDSSPAMLERLSARCAADGVSVSPILGNMVNAMPNGPYSCVFVAYNTVFNLVTAEAQQSLFHRAAKVLATDGALVVEAFVPDPQRPPGGTVGVRSIATDRVVLVADNHDAEAQTVEGQFIEFTESQGVRLRPFRIRYSYISELDAMAAAAGLRLDRRIDHMTGADFHADSTAHISIYRR